MSKPWTAVPYGDLAYTIVDADNREVAYVRQYAGNKADALVMAAAPELLEACKLAVKSWFNGEISENMMEITLKSAIAKAEGK